MNKAVVELLQDAVIALESFKGTMDRDLYRRDIQPIAGRIRNYLIEYELEQIRNKVRKQKENPEELDTVPQPLLPTAIQNAWRDTKS